MATITVNNATLCAGGGHLHATTIVNGGAARSVAFDTDDLRGSPSADEVRDAVRTLIRLQLMGMTRAQAVVAVQAGFTISIGA